MDLKLAPCKQQVVKDCVKRMALWDVHTVIPYARDWSRGARWSMGDRLYCLFSIFVPRRTRPSGQVKALQVICAMASDGLLKRPS